MDFSIATLLSHFSDDKLVAGKLLEKKLGCQTDEELEILQIVLDTLERVGILTKERGKYRRLPEEGVVEAKLRCSSKGFCFAIQDDEDAEDIYVRESHLSSAWNGDRVLVKIIKEGTRRRSPEGEVRLILDRANPSLLAQIKQRAQAFRAVPLDDRLLFELDLQANGLDLAAAIDHLVHVAVLRYPLAQHPSLGQVTKILGSTAEAASDVDIVFCKHDLPLTWPSEVLNTDHLAPAQEDLERADYRSLLTFTLGDENAPWQETAFSLEVQEQNYRLGLHVTDIARWVAEGSPLDRAARKRGTSVFLGHQVCPLLPEYLSQHCSLVVGGDRQTLSFWLDFNAQAEVVGFEYEATVIQVDRHFSFQTVQELLAEPENIGAPLQPFLQRFRQLFFELSPHLQAQRRHRGGFSVQTETAVHFLDEGRWGILMNSPQLPLRTLLTEVVIAAQKQVAKHLEALGVPALYCSQPEPDWEELTDLIKLAQNLGIDFSFDSEAQVNPQDYARLTQGFEKVGASQILNHLLLNTIKTPKYSSHPAPHFGLAYSDGYTHCLAPAQRYADLINQRILKLVLTEGRDRRTKQNKTGVNLRTQDCHGQINWNVFPPALQEQLSEELHLLVTHLNEREKIAADAEKDLAGLRKAEKMKAHTGQTFRGLITGVQSYGFFVEIEDLLVEGLVHVSSLKDDWYEYRARHSCLVGRKSRTAYRLGNAIEVQVKSVDYYRQQIDLVAVNEVDTPLEDTSPPDWDELAETGELGKNC
jgi:ribonuclease R